jgi:hypothetical protein
MGHGGMGTANAFMQYAKTCYRYRRPRNHDNDEDDGDNAEESIKALALSVYERGIAECPTVEALWLSYLRHLLFLVRDNPNMAALRLRSVVDRAVRNCPYSLPLFQQKLRVHLLLADLKLSIFDPDEIMTTVQEEALGAKFITSPEACLQLHMTAIQCMRRRILTMLATDGKTTMLNYDDAEPVQPSPTAAADDGKFGQELEDLCDDLREMYDAVDAYLRKCHSSWSEGRSRLWSDRAFTETHLLGPLVDSLDREGTNKNKRAAEVIRCYDRLTKVHQPTHPGSFSSYITTLLGSFATKNPIKVL